jgi:hypothetical protein
LGAYLPECLNLTPHLSWIIRWILGVYAPDYAGGNTADSRQSGTMNLNAKFVLSAVNRDITLK